MGPTCERGRGGRGAGRQGESGEGKCQYFGTYRRAYPKEKPSNVQNYGHYVQDTTPSKYILLLLDAAAIDSVPKICPYLLSDHVHRGLRTVGRDLVHDAGIRGLPAVRPRSQWFLHERCVSLRLGRLHRALQKFVIPRNRRVACRVEQPAVDGLRAQRYGATKMRVEQNMKRNELKRMQGERWKSAARSMQLRPETKKKRAPT